MLFLVSDIHGDLKKFNLLLNKIDFNGSQDNHMIVLGDILDRGPDGIELLNTMVPMIEKGTMQLIMGNHELFCSLYLHNSMNPEIWEAFGGKDALREVMQMNNKDKNALMKFLDELPMFIEGKSEYLGDFVCTHSGIHTKYLIENPNNTINVKKSISEAYSKDRYGFLCGLDLHYLPKEKVLDKYLIVGHVPCNRLRGDINNNHFIRTSRYMDIDAGNGYEGGKLGCYIVDSDEEIYIYERLLNMSII